MSPRPREREDEQQDHDEPAQRHPHSGVESHEVGAAARPRSEVMPAPSAVVDGFDLVLRVRYDASCKGKAVRDDAGGRPAVVSGGESLDSSRAERRLWWGG